MLRLCIGELAEITGGQLTLGSLPPLAGTFEPVRRVVVDSREVKAGDVFWGLVGENYDGARRAEDAFMRGALGVVVCGRHVEPWAGRFSLRVADANLALLHLSASRPGRLPKKFQPHWAGGTTQMVNRLLAGHACNLNLLIERLTSAGDRQRTHHGAHYSSSETLEVPPTVS
jgi:hypothetical protein